MKRKIEATPIMKLSEAGRMVPVKYSTLWRWAKTGKLPAIQIGRTIFIRRKEFMKLLESPDERPAA